VIAAAARTGSAAPQVTGKVASVLEHLLEEQGYITLLDTDRSPSVVDEGAMTSDKGNDAAVAADMELHRQQLYRGLRGAKANDPQADPLTALDTAARTVHARGTTGTVVLVDSGLQTTGALRYATSDLLLASGSDVVGHLRSTRQLPDLSGITVLLVGLGDTAKPQTRVDSATRGRLVEQWTAISSAAGATCVEVDSQPLTTSPPADLPEVMRVDVPEPAEPELPDDRQAPVPLREDSVGFLDDSAELRDPTAASKSLERLAQHIVAGHYRVSLVGTTATAGTEEGRRTLSLQRANAVRNLLVDLGVPEDRIKTRGVGIHHPLHVDDLDKSGNLIPGAAVKNRAVFLSVRPG